jgi:hypothetical protein
MAIPASLPPAETKRSPTPPPAAAAPPAKAAPLDQVLTPAQSANEKARAWIDSQLDAIIAYDPARPGLYDPEPIYATQQRLAAPLMKYVQNDAALAVLVQELNALAATNPEKARLFWLRMYGVSRFALEERLLRATDADPRSPLWASALRSLGGQAGIDFDSFVFKANTSDRLVQNLGRFATAWSEGKLQKALAAMADLGLPPGGRPSAAQIATYARAIADLPIRPGMQPMSRDLATAFAAMRDPLSKEAAAKRWSANGVLHPEIEKYRYDEDLWNDILRERIRKKNLGPIERFVEWLNNYLA